MSALKTEPQTRKKTVIKQKLLLIILLVIYIPLEINDISSGIFYLRIYFCNIVADKLPLSEKLAEFESFVLHMGSVVGIVYG